MNMGLKNVLLVSSDEDLNKALIDQFELLKVFEVEVYHTLQSCNNFCKPDLMIYNHQFNDGKKLDISNWFKRNVIEYKVIILGTSFKSPLETSVMNLENYIYIEKPFVYDFLEKAILESLEKSLANILYLNDIKFFPNKKVLINSCGIEIRLTEKEAGIILLLYNSANQTVSKETLLKEVWRYRDGVTTHTLETHLYHLRKKLDDDIVITTEKGGYSISI